MKRLWIGPLSLAFFVFASGGEALAAGKAALLREVAEHLGRRQGKELLNETAQALVTRLEAMVARHGDEVLEAVRKGGPAALRAIEAAGPEGGKLIRLFTRYGEEVVWVVQRPERIKLFLDHGDEAAQALIRHRQLAEPVVATLGQPAAKALALLNPQNGRRLALMMQEGSLQKMSRPDDLLNVIGTYGDRAMDFVWRHKGALLTTAALVAFVNDPIPFLNGVRDLAEVVGRTAINPVSEGAKEVARGVNWTVILVTGMIVAWVSWKTVGRKDKG